MLELTTFFRRWEYRSWEGIGSPVIFVIGRPGAGKSTVVGHLRARFQRSLPGDCPIHAVDEFEILRSFADAGSCSKVRWNQQGSVEILDSERVFAATTRELERQIASHSRERGVVLCELARSAYAPLFSKFGPAVLDAAYVLYVKAPLNLCCERNERRRTRNTENYVPEGVLRMHYAKDDVDRLAEAFGTRFVLVENGENGVGELGKAIDGFLVRFRADVSLTHGEYTMAKPNLFDYATKELSQDAVICWLVAWAGAETNAGSAEEELRRCGRAFIDALFSKWEGWGKVKLGDRVRTEVIEQESSIDVLARVDSRHVLLIEDKTETGAHDDQLARYWDLVVEGKTSFGPVSVEDLYLIYCRTGNFSLKDRQHAEEQEYAVFDRTDFLRVLESYRGQNEILLDFRSHLKRWQVETEGFREWTTDVDDRTKRSWEGFYRFIEDNCLVDSNDEWGPLSSLVGGYNGLWIEPNETSSDSRFALWIDEETVSFRLYGAKTKVSVRGMNRVKEYWASAFVDRGGGRLTRPQRFEATKTKPMCVAEWRDWLEFGDDGRLDLESSVKNLAVAREILLTTIGSDQSS